MSMFFYPGLQFLKDFLLQHPHQAQVALCDIDWPTFFNLSARAAGMNTRLQTIKGETSLIGKRNIWSMEFTMEDLAHLPSEERKEKVEEFVRNILAAYTEGVSDQVDLSIGLYKYGVDSISATDISQQIRNGIGAVFEVKKNHKL